MVAGRPVLRIRLQSLELEARWNWTKDGCQMHWPAGPGLAPRAFGRSLGSPRAHWAELQLRWLEPVRDRKEDPRMASVREHDWVWQSLTPVRRPSVKKDHRRAQVEGCATAGLREQKVQAAMLPKTRAVRADFAPRCGEHRETALRPPRPRQTCPPASSSLLLAVHCQNWRTRSRCCSRRRPALLALLPLLPPPRGEAEGLELGPPLGLSWESGKASAASRTASPSVDPRWSCQLQRLPCLRLHLRVPQHPPAGRE
mmetsp:Transcript_19164/g.55687  ORF Transcript_19164/g.55687 Transcript_19164/m.55687 type:complete len:256 (+) Transcript_19164:1226-1993(+)